MAANDKSIPTVTITRTRRPSTDSLAISVKTPRTARFAEATSIHSPIEPTLASRNPFVDPPINHYKPQPQPADIGFGYLSANNTTTRTTEVEMDDTDNRYLPPPTPRSPLASPLKSALKSPGAAPRDFGNVLSPTFQEEQVLDKEEEKTDKQQASDLKVKFRVRVAKMVLRGINFSCSLIVLSMLATTFAIFNATSTLPARNGLPPWAANTKPWPQIVLLVIACISLFMSMIILSAYFRGGHRRAEKVAVYYTTFAVAFFVFSIIMWGVGAGILNQSKTQGSGQDLWGWSCKDNKRRALFQDDVSYALICRLQDWSLVCCIIEVVVETLCIIIYGIVFFRFYSKRRLRKSMAVRDRARSDLYLAQLRSQSAPNTPGFGPMSPRSGGWRPPPGHPLYQDPLSAAEKGDAMPGTPANPNTQFPRGFASPKPFQLMPAPPPIKVQSATPRVEQEGFEATSVSRYSPPPPSLSPGPVRQHDHVPAAPGEQRYAAVPIPGAYASPLASPANAVQTPMKFNFGPEVTGHQRS